MSRRARERGEGRGQEPNHTTARRPGPLQSIKNSLLDPLKMRTSHWSNALRVQLRSKANRDVVIKFSVRESAWNRLVMGGGGGDGGITLIVSDVKIEVVGTCPGNFFLRIMTTSNKFEK